MRNPLPVIIYTLNDPRTGLPYYVGKTKSLMTRLRRHLNGGSRAPDSDARTLEIRALGLRPGITIWEKCDEAVWQERERFWVAHFRSFGFLLLNRLPGGWNPPVAKGSRMSAEHRGAISEALKGKKKSAEHNKANAAARKGKPLSPEHRKAISEGHKKAMTEERREQLKRASRSRWT